MGPLFLRDESANDAPYFGCSTVLMMVRILDTPFNPGFGLILGRCLRLIICLLVQLSI
jgi:hypothetical protein